MHNKSNGNEKHIPQCAENDEIIRFDLSHLGASVNLLDALGLKVLKDLKQQMSQERKLRWKHTFASSFCAVAESSILTNCSWQAWMKLDVVSSLGSARTRTQIYKHCSHANEL